MHKVFPARKGKSSPLALLACLTFIATHTMLHVQPDVTLHRNNLTKSSLLDFDELLILSSLN